MLSFSNGIGVFFHRGEGTDLIENEHEFLC